MAGTALTRQRVLPRGPNGKEDPPVMRLKSRSARIEAPAPAAAPLYVLRGADGPTSDLVCAVCSRVVAYGVPTVRAEDEAPFYLELHGPSCLRVHA